MNFLQLISGFGEDVMDELAGGFDAWIERVERLYAQAKLAVGVPAGLFVLAMLIGGFGQSESGDVTARVLMDIAAVLAAPLFLCAIFNGTVLGTFLAAASLVANKISGDVIPKIEPALVAQMSKKAIAISAWLLMVCLAGMFVPLWRSFHWTCVLVVATFIIAAIMASWGFKAQWLKKVAVGLVVGIVLIGLAQFNASLKRFGNAAGDNAAARLDKLTDKTEVATKAIIEGKEPPADEEPASTPATEAEEANGSQVSGETEPSAAAATNANAAPPDESGTASPDVGEADGEQASVDQPTGSSRPKTSLSKQFDDLYGDL